MLTLKTKLTCSARKFNFHPFANWTIFFLQTHFEKHYANDIQFNLSQGLSMSFHPNFTQFLSRFYQDFILILSWFIWNSFDSNFIKILSRKNVNIWTGLMHCNDREHGRLWTIFQRKKQNSHVFKEVPC